MTRTTRNLTSALLAAFVLAAVPAANASTVIDSFTDPLPPNPLLPASGQPILFLGPICDGASCPPGTIVTNLSSDDVAQSGLAGVFGGARESELGTTLDCCQDEGALRIDPAAGGTLIFSPRTPGLYAFLSWGPSPFYGVAGDPLNLSLAAEGSDRFEVDVLALVGSVGINVELLSFDDKGDLDGFAWGGVSASNPGVISIPFAGLTSLPPFTGLDEFADDVDSIHMTFFYGGELSDLVVGEVRTAGSPVPAATSSWGRLKSAYRR